MVKVGGTVPRSRREAGGLMVVMLEGTGERLILMLNIQLMGLFAFNTKCCIKAS